MADNPVIYAYLEAGAKSSPVALDPGLDTGKPETVWLFNLVRDEFVEYRRDIVEAKLRDLTAGEQQLCKKLKAAFAKARDTFQPGPPSPLTIPERAPAPVAKATEAMELDEELLAIDNDLETAAELDEELE